MITSPATPPKSTKTTTATTTEPTTITMVIPSLAMSPSSTSSSSSSSSYKEENLGGKELVPYESSSGEKQKTKSSSTTSTQTPTSGAHHHYPTNRTGEAQNNYDPDKDDDADDDEDGEVEVEEVGSPGICADSVCRTLNRATDDDSDDAFVVAKQETEESKQRKRRTHYKSSRSCVPTMSPEFSDSSTSLSTTEFFKALLEQPPRISSSTKSTTITTSRKRQDHHHHHDGRPGRQSVRHNQHRRQQLLELARYLQAKTVPVNVSIPPMNEPELAIPTWRMFYEHSEYLDRTLQPLLDLLSYDDDSISSMKTSLCTCTTLPTSSSSSSYSCSHCIESRSRDATTALDNTTTLGLKQKKSRNIEHFGVTQNTNIEARNEVYKTSSTTLNPTNYFQYRGDDENEDDDREWSEECYNLRQSERILRRELLRVDKRMARRRQYNDSHINLQVDSRNDAHQLSDIFDSTNFTIVDKSMLNTPDWDARVRRHERLSPFSSYNNPNDISRTQCSTTRLRSSRKVFRTKNGISRKVVNLIGTTILSLTGIKILVLLQHQDQLQDTGIHQPVVDRKIQLLRDVAIDLDCFPQLLRSTNSTSTWSRLSENDDRNTMSRLEQHPQIICGRK